VRGLLIALIKCAARKYVSDGEWRGMQQVPYKLTSMGEKSRRVPIRLLRKESQNKTKGDGTP